MQRHSCKGSHQSPEGEAESIQKAAEKQRTGEESTDRYITGGKQEKLIISIVGGNELFFCPDYGKIEKYYSHFYQSAMVA